MDAPLSERTALSKVADEICRFCSTSSSGIDLSFSEHVAIDRLAQSLASAIGILKQPRTRAKVTSKLPIIVFGATSEGELWKLYVAYEPEPWQYGIVCVSPDCEHEFQNRLT